MGLNGGGGPNGARRSGERGRQGRGGGAGRRGNGSGSRGAAGRLHGAVRGLAKRVAARAVDMLAAVVLLLLTAPMLLLGALAVYLDSGRPVFFGHRRIGRGGRPFRCWKLRTMHPDAEARLSLDPTLRRDYIRNGFKLPADRDPRVTRVGRWLRRRYLDELPQLFNVLNGTMSLVGPRPLVEDELAMFGEDVDLLLSARPGVFGEWTSRGRRRPDYPERARMELDYLRRPSARRDAAVLLRSVGVVLRGQED